MKALLAVYQAQFRVTFATQLQYRASALIWLLGTVLEPVIYLVIWSTVARASGGSVGSYSVAGFAGYYLVLMLVNHITFTWIMFEYEFRIRQGMFSPLLLRPIHPIHKDIADNITYKIITFPALLLAAVGLAFVFHPVIAPPGWAMLAAVPAIVLACCIRFFVEWTLAMAAFWTTRIGAINQMYFVTLLFLSGQMAPLDLMPAPVQLAATVLPFRWMVAYPVELILGRLTPAAALTGLAVQASWLVLSLLLLLVVWRAGVRTYSAVGA